LPAFFIPSLTVPVARATGLLPDCERFERELRRLDARPGDERDDVLRLLAVERDPLLRLLAERELARAVPELPLRRARVELEPDLFAGLGFDRALLVDRRFVCCGISPSSPLERLKLSAFVYPESRTAKG
jgi:hypothetical protein